MILLALVWAVSAGAYVLFEGQFSPDELGAAAVTGLLAAALWAAMRRTAPVSFRFGREALAAWGRALGGAPPAALKTAGKLIAAVLDRRGGAIAVRPFVRGRREDPADAARRAVAVLAASLAPDAFVLRAPEDRDELVIRRIVETKAGENLRWGL